MDDARNDLMQELFSRLNARKFSSIAELLTDDAVFDVAYAPDLSSFTNPVRGADEVQAVFENVVASMFYPLDFRIVEAYLGKDPEVAIVEYASSGVATPTGRSYSNRYVGVFKVRDGKIAQWREYHNPERMIEAFGDQSGSRTEAGTGS